MKFTEYQARITFHINLLINGSKTHLPLTVNQGDKLMYDGMNVQFRGYEAACLPLAKMIGSWMIPTGAFSEEGSAEQAAETPDSIEEIVDAPAPAKSRAAVVTDNVVGATRMKSDAGPNDVTVTGTKPGTRGFDQLEVVKVNDRVSNTAAERQVVADRSRIKVAVGDNAVVANTSSRGQKDLSSQGNTVVDVTKGAKTRVAEIATTATKPTAAVAQTTQAAKPRIKVEIVNDGAEVVGKVSAKVADEAGAIVVNPNKVEVTPPTRLKVAANQQDGEVVNVKDIKKQFEAAKPAEAPTLTVDQIIDGIKYEGKKWAALSWQKKVEFIGTATKEQLDAINTLELTAAVRKALEAKLASI